ncbi:DUF4175 domain-containing protein [Paracoccus sp. TK19116]|uniref:DUF4175 domain-containing protein n=1 Tax=Paracoccus albicereus TaxID=2922394 RepID=A0ABT1MSJ7_9RHOB|nr:DUF4175 domain-containing protein [Paracoccus albicereus]MCQ0971290.1 DUF4175 domain-containing protein [Paracoccus albicereus]
MALRRFRSARPRPGRADASPEPDIHGSQAAHRAVRLTRWGMVWEQAARAFWPLVTLTSLIFALLSLGGVEAAPPVVLPWLAGLAVLALIAASVWGGLRYARVSEDAAEARVDATLPGRPLTALSDHAAIGGEGALWQAHLAQMRAQADGARAVRPDAELTRRDPYALRLAGMVALAMALIFGGAGQLGQGMEAIAATFRPAPERGEDVATGPSWEGWAQPPAYTGRPTVYLNALAEGQDLELPKGSEVTFRLYGEGIGVTQDIGTSVDEDPLAPAFTAEMTGTIEVAGRSFPITVLPDNAPTVAAGNAPERRADGRLVQDFTAQDDHGVVSGEAAIDLDLASVTREFGLAVDPEPREALVLDLPMPRGQRKDIAGQLVEDLSRHPFANLPVTVSLRVQDGIEQQGEAAPMQTILPGRRFFNPVASALVEIRRDLLWSRDNARRSAEILRALTWQPEGFIDPVLYQELRGGVTLLESGPLAEEPRDDLAEALWQAALKLEDGGLADALARMREAQEKLSEAIRNGASEDEIQRLMDELREATDAYTQMLAEQGEQQDPADRFAQNPPQGQSITGDQIQQMMDEIQRLMNEGRMAEAQQLLEQFNRMMENLEVRQGQPGEGDGQGSPMNRSMNELADTLREQQELSDEAFGEMQRQFREGGQGGEQQRGEMGDRQQELRQQLGQQRGLMPGQGSEQGDAARRQLDEAGRAMEDAEQALREGDMAGAMERQADAIESMREGMRAMGEMMGEGEQQAQDGQQQGQQGQQGQPGQQGQAQGQGQQSQGRAMLDPLGRELSGNGNRITTGDPLAEGVDPAARARDLLDEIRRRSGERSRPEDERDYLGRLLDRF